MTNISTFMPVETQPIKLPRHLHPLALLRMTIATFRERRRFRADLERVLADNPHLIADIGLKTWEAKAEIAKHVWEK